MTTKKLTVAVVAILLCGVVAWALDDTPENRDAQADRYLKIMPVKELIADTAPLYAKTLPESQRQGYCDLLTKHFDSAAVEQAMKKALVKTFTAEELKALSDFYGSPIGKSAMKKMGAYSADIMPVIQEEILKAKVKAEEQMSKDQSAPPEEKGEAPDSK